MTEPKPTKPYKALYYEQKQSIARLREALEDMLSDYKEVRDEWSGDILNKADAIIAKAEEALRESSDDVK